MAHESTDVLILRSVPRGENDRLITCVTADGGRFYAIVKGASSMKRRETAASEPFMYVNVELYERGGMKWVKSASVVEPFLGLRRDMDKLFLAAYIADVVFELTDESTPAGEILPLALNTFFALCASGADTARIKAAFELRAACIAGFTPDLSACARCHGTVGDAWLLDVMNGSVLCRACFGRAQDLSSLVHAEEMGERQLLVPLDGSALAALSFVVTADPRRVFAFRLARESLDGFCRAAELFLLHHLERGFASLENYKKLASFAPGV